MAKKKVRRSSSKKTTEPRTDFPGCIALQTNPHANQHDVVVLNTKLCNNFPWPGEFLICCEQHLVIAVVSSKRIAMQRMKTPASFCSRCTESQTTKPRRKPPTKANVPFTGSVTSDPPVPTGQP